MLIQFLHRGRTYHLRAWTGGDRPELETRYCRIAGGDWGMLGKPAFNYVRMALYREALADWFSFWGDLPDLDTRLIFWSRASSDAWRTLTDGRA